MMIEMGSMGSKLHGRVSMMISIRLVLSKQT